MCQSNCGRGAARPLVNRKFLMSEEYANPAFAPIAFDFENSKLNSDQNGIVFSGKDVLGIVQAAFDEATTLTWPLEIAPSRFGVRVQESAAVVVALSVIYADPIAAMATPTSSTAEMPIPTSWSMLPLRWTVRDGSMASARSDFMNLSRAGVA